MGVAALCCAAHRASRPRARLAKKLTILYLSPFHSSNTHSTTRALSTFLSTDLKYSCEATLTTTGVRSAASRSFRRSAMREPQKA
ncbi:Uncharacterised protein [Mycobacterium tuberculosis]|nr:Uncharacterised protein [Mycobacterium tuberculosis]